MSKKTCSKTYIRIIANVWNTGRPLVRERKVLRQTGSTKWERDILKKQFEGLVYEKMPGPDKLKRLCELTGCNSLLYQSSEKRDSFDIVFITFHFEVVKSVINTKTGDSHHLKKVKSRHILPFAIAQNPIEIGYPKIQRVYRIGDMRYLSMRIQEETKDIVSDILPVVKDSCDYYITLTQESFDSEVTGEKFFYTEDNQYKVQSLTEQGVMDELNIIPIGQTKQMRLHWLIMNLLDKFHKVNVVRYSFPSLFEASQHFLFHNLVNPYKGIFTVESDPDKPVLYEIVPVEGINHIEEPLILPKVK